MSGVQGFLTAKASGIYDLEKSPQFPADFVYILTSPAHIHKPVVELSLAVFFFGAFVWDKFSFDVSVDEVENS